MTEEKKPFIACNYVPAMSGHFATLYQWTQEKDYGFYEPYATGFGRYETLDDAEAEGRAWAEAEGVEFVLVDREKAARAAVNRKQRMAYVQSLRDAGMSFMRAYQIGKEKFPE